jgi:hypothetical protein
MTGYNSETLADAAVMMAGLQQFVRDARDLDYVPFAFTVSVESGVTGQYLKFTLSDDGEVVLDA